MYRLQVLAQVPISTSGHKYWSLQHQYLTSTRSFFQVSKYLGPVHALRGMDTITGHIISTLKMELHELYNVLKFARRQLDLKKISIEKKPNIIEFIAYLKNEHLKSVLGMTASVA